MRWILSFALANLFAFTSALAQISVLVGAGPLTAIHSERSTGESDPNIRELEQRWAAGLQLSGGIAYRLSDLVEARLRGALAYRTDRSVLNRGGSPAQNWWSGGARYFQSNLGVELAYRVAPGIRVLAGAGRQHTLGILSSAQPGRWWTDRQNLPEATSVVRGGIEADVRGVTLRLDYGHTLEADFEGFIPPAEILTRRWRTIGLSLVQRIRFGQETSTTDNPLDSLLARSSQEMLGWLPERLQLRTEISQTIATNTFGGTPIQRDYYSRSRIDVLLSTQVRSRFGILTGLGYARRRLLYGERGWQTPVGMPGVFQPDHEINLSLGTEVFVLSWLSLAPGIEVCFPLTTNGIGRGIGIGDEFTETTPSVGVLGVATFTGRVFWGRRFNALLRGTSTITEPYNRFPGTPPGQDLRIKS